MAEKRRSLTARSRRFAPPGFAYHIGNRAIERRQIFFEDVDYEWFLRLVVEAKSRCRVKVYGVCPMPTHFHAVVEPELEGALSAFCNRVEGGYARYVRRSSGTVGVGHVFQDRFWNEGIEDSLHFLNVLRYVESNPLHAKLVGRAADWPWSSLILRQTMTQLIDPPRFALPDDWEAIVESPMTVREMLEVRYEEGLLRNRRTKISRNVNSKPNAR